jgi:hypothetical protein
VIIPGLPTQGNLHNIEVRCSFYSPSERSCPVDPNRSQARLLNTSLTQNVRENKKITNFKMS